METSNGFVSGIQLVTYSKTQFSKSEQYARLMKCNSASCVVCRRDDPPWASYMELPDNKELVNGKDLRIWYFICHPCLSEIPSTNLKSLLLNTIKSQRN